MTTRATQSTGGPPNVVLLVEQHVAADLAECEKEITRSEARTRELVARRERLRAIARAADVPCEVIPEPQLTVVQDEVS